MARKPNKHDISLALAVPTDGDDVLNGSNREDQPGDVIDGGLGNDTIDGLQGADTLTGGEGSDTFHLYWSSSNIGTGVDTITDFEAADLFDLRAMPSHQSEADILTAVFRTLEWGDITFTAIDVDLDGTMDGNHMHIEVVDGDPTWDTDMIVLGATPVESQFIFA